MTAVPEDDRAPAGPLRLRWSARSEVGLVREGNEDSGYAGTRLLAVADGMGGMVAGDVASNLTVEVLRRLDDAVADDVTHALRTAIDGANERLRVAVQADPGLEGMGTTVTALLWDGTVLGLAHIGDSRGYLLRDGRLERLTHDHTFVQSLIDDGRLTEAEARVHPHRSLLLRALDGRAEVDPDVAKLEMLEGDRFLLCSDGLCGYVDDEAIAVALAEPDRDRAVDSLVELALLAGGVDNVTCLVADAVGVGSRADVLGDHGLAGTISAAATVRSPGPHAVATPPVAAPAPGAGTVDAVLIGAAAYEPDVSAQVLEALAQTAPVDAHPALARRRPGTGRTAAGGEARSAGRGPARRRRGGGARAAVVDTDEAADPAAGDAGASAVAADTSADPEEIRYALLDPRRSRWFGRILVLVLALAVVAVGVQQGWAWSQRQYYVGAEDGHVAIYRGLSENLVGISLSSVYSSDPTLTIESLPPYYRQRVQSSLSAGDLTSARNVVATLQAIADHCRTVSTDQQCQGDEPLQTTPAPVAPSPTPVPTPTSTPLATRPVTTTIRPAPRPTPEKTQPKTTGAQR